MGHPVPKLKKKAQHWISGEEDDGGLIEFFTPGS
jgi:hypothetical protein